MLVLRIDLVALVLAVLLAVVSVALHVLLALPVLLATAAPVALYLGLWLLAAVAVHFGRDT